MVGMKSFHLLLSGAEEMDQHFAATPLDKNLPMILGYWVSGYQLIFGALSW